MVPEKTMNASFMASSFWFVNRMLNVYLQEVNLNLKQLILLN
jgi:primosomal protein N''